ncbi:cuticle protein 19-like [Neocloeon triangulifer]|uniref:cuticle protein 19-like n=1 Tax=Neocloeon triangulifer TaxID=2078957 RepID=UPI00286F9A60|nr:cuticle protein 19-like [Neocloeon triangulifer]
MASARMVVLCLALAVVAVSAQFDANGYGYGGQGGQDGGHGQYGGHHLDYYHHPKYNFQYGVHDDHTHDIKKHSEKRDGDHTEGEYSFKEADGTTRTVKYYVKGKSGFVATVHHSGHASHPAQTNHYAGHHDNGYAGGFGGQY